MTLRVMGGTLKGRKLTAPRGDGVRPTSSKVRESLFSILGHRLDGLAALDLYAGAGTLGIEAASRGARRVVFVEADSGHIRALRRNVVLLDGVAEADVLRMDARRAPKRLREAFDVVFLDPPYSKGLAQETLEGLAEAADTILSEGAVVVVESSVEDALPESVGTLRRDDERRYGGTTLSFYRGPHGVAGEA
jgi:16S rRNA (guanine(966)-N(2))-methyltransferase RsmD